MTILIFNLKRMLTRKKWFVSMYVLPVAISIIVTYINFDFPKLKVGVVDYDKTQLTKMLVRNLSDNYNIENIEANQINEKIQSGQLNYAVVIDNGFTNSIINGEKSLSLNAFYEKESDAYKVVDESINSFISSARKVTDSVKDEESFYRTLDKEISSNTKYFATESLDKGIIAGTLNFLVMFMLFNAFALIGEFVNKKDDNIRIFAAPLTIKSYMLQNVLTLFLLELVEVLIMFIALAVLYNTVMLEYFGMLLLLYIIFSFVAVSLALAINYFSSIYLKKDISSSIIIVPMCMFGGCFWSTEMMPAGFRFVSQFLPTTWITTGTVDILTNKGFSKLGIDAAMLFLFGAVFLLLGVFTKRDIVK